MFQKHKILHGSLDSVLPPPHSFGQSQDLNDNYIVIGADDLSMINTKECGGIYIFDKEYNELQYLYTDRDKSFYGWDVSITSDDTIIVGADDEDNKSSYNGACFILKKGVHDFYIHKKLFAKHNKEGAYFGYSIDNNNKYVAISAPSYQSRVFDIVHNDDDMYYSSQPYVYIYDTKTYELVTTLTIDHPLLPSIHSSFGCNIKFSTNYLIITEHTYHRTYIYDNKTFNLINMINNYNSESIDVRDDYLVIGDPTSCKIMIIDIKTSKLIHEINRQDISNFGYKVAINDNIIAVASNYNTSYLYENVIMDDNSKGDIHIYNFSDNFDPPLLKDVIENDFCQSLKLDDGKLYCGNPVVNNMYGVINVYTS